MDHRRDFSAYASRPDAQWLLFGIAFLEGVFIPLPSDFLLIPMALLAPERAFRYAFIAGLGSVCGAMVGYFLGFGFYSLISGVMAQFTWFNMFLDIYRNYAGIFLFSAGFSAVPFSIVTFLSGMAHVNPVLFFGITLVVRCVRYAVISWLIWRGGSRYQEWLERNFYGTMLVMTLALLVVSAIGVLLFETA